MLSPEDVVVLQKSISKAEFGDFQTPLALTKELCTLLRDRGVTPSLIIEPTCGTGGFLVAGAETFKRSRLIGVEINESYKAETEKRLAELGCLDRCSLYCRDFFGLDLNEFMSSERSEILFLGNPPWITSAQMGRIGGQNLPPKSNIKSLDGLEALSGASNFDISEWILIRLLQSLQNRNATIAMICKKSVARKILEYAALKEYRFRCLGIWDIDARQHFDVSVEACFFVFTTKKQGADYTCPCFSDGNETRTIGIRQGMVVSDTKAFDARSPTLKGKDSLTWRSGVKHDCSKIMELELDSEGHYINGYNKKNILEDTYIYPLLKSTSLYNSKKNNVKYVLITQKNLGEETSSIKEIAPRTWDYLNRNIEHFVKRKSSIYKNKPNFSIFGIGSYAFSPWKVAISGLHKTFKFSLVGPRNGKPVMLDDTCYFLGFSEKNQAEIALRMMASSPSLEFLRSLVFWDAKRPITKKILETLHLGKLAHALKQHSDSVDLTHDQLDDFIIHLDS